MLASRDLRTVSLYDLVSCAAPVRAPIPWSAAEKTGSWTLLTLPKNASAKLPSRGMTMVEGTIDGFPFRAASGSKRGPSSRASAVTASVSQVIT
ncbi:MAG: hypothetical protein DMG49_14295 [Acidobacteria bacterium]|nr:MAG: hypothetical protein DMG49_14295 [Acidobacteriota bacterium]